MMSNLVAVLWSVYVVRAWTRPGHVSDGLARVCRCIAPLLGLNEQTFLCKCTHDEKDDMKDEAFPHQNGDANNHNIYKDSAVESDAETLSLNGKSPVQKKKSTTGNFKACKWHLVMDVVDRIFLLGFCLVMVTAILVLFIIYPYIHGKIFV